MARLGPAWRLLHITVKSTLVATALVFIQIADNTHDTVYCWDPINEACSAYSADAIPDCSAKLGTQCLSSHSQKPALMTNVAFC